VPLLLPLNGYGDQPSDETTPITLKMEDSKASRRGKLQLTEEEQNAPQKAERHVEKHHQRDHRQLRQGWGSRKALIAVTIRAMP
jgi:hypothetical protein